MTPDLRDLRDLLAAAGAEERAAADPLDVAALLGRAHRRRAVRGTTYSAIGLGAAAAIAVGAVSADGLWRDDEPPVPPATETATPRPTRTPADEPTPTPTPTETADAFEPDWSTCGQSVWLDDWFLQEESDLWLERADRGIVPADRPLALDAEVRSIDPLADATLRLVSAFALEVDDEGMATLVGVAAAPLDVLVTGDVGPGSGPAVPPTDLRFTSCEASPASGGSGALDEPLDPAGLYAIGVVAELTRADGTTARFSLFVGDMGTEREWGEPAPSYTPGPRPSTGLDHELTPGTPLRLGVGETYNPTNLTWNELSISCGQPVQHVPSANVEDPSVTSSASAFLDGGGLVVRLSMTNTSGHDLTDVLIEYPAVVILRDGIAYGSAWLDGGLVLAAAAPWRPGEELQVEWSLGPKPCAFAGDEPWTSGSYAVGTSIHVFHGTPEAPTPIGIESITEGPFPFTLD